jgi:DNA-binding response OmpR family regulator
MKQPKAKILVVEDDPALIRGLLDLLAFNGFEPEGVEDGQAALERALSGNFDLILLDVMLPGLDGFSICREVRKAKPNQPIIMLTAKGAEEDVVAGFKAGADDYVAKPFSLRELMVRVEAVLRRAGKNVGGERVEVAGLVFDSATLKLSLGDESVELTRREMDIVIYLNRNRDRIVSKKELLGNVWNYPDTEVETRTVDIHMLKLRKKIAALAPDSPLIQTVRGEGYRLGIE